MKTRILAFVSAVTLPVQLHAQSDEQISLATEYANMPEVQRMMDEMFAPSSLASQFEAGLPPNVKLDDTQREKIGALMSEIMNSIRPGMEELMVTGSAENFSADELKALIAFYSSEHGASIMTKMQPFMLQVMSQIQPVIQSKMQAAQPEIVKIIQGN